MKIYPCLEGSLLALVCAQGRVDEERYLTELGRSQADMTGQRLAKLYSKYLRKLDEEGRE